MSVIKRQDIPISESEMNFYLRWVGIVVFAEGSLLLNSVLAVDIKL